MTNDDRVAYLAGGDGGPLDSAERDELDQVRGVLRDPAVWAEPGPDLEDRIVAAIADAARADMAPADAAPADTAPVDTAPADAAPGDELAHRRSRWVRYALAGVAAAAVLAVALTISLNRGPQPVEFAASLSGTPLAAGASGQATLTKTTSGWRISLHATGLPRLDNGRYYEAWLKNAAGQLVPIGTFNQPENVTLWSGVPPSSHPTMTVTQQLANGNPASSGQVVLKGTTHRTH